VGSNKNPTHVQVLEVYTEGFRNIYWRSMLPSDNDEWKRMEYPVSVWHFDKYEYSFNAPKHIINIDGKEIELSEECYNKLKESLV